jgi:hypothetical protein
MHACRDCISLIAHAVRIRIAAADCCASGSKTYRSVATEDHYSVHIYVLVRILNSMDRFIIRRPKHELQPSDTAIEFVATEASDTAIESQAASSTGVDEDESADVASCFVTSFVPMAMSPHMQVPVVLTDHHKTINGVVFIKLSKGDWRINLMLLGHVMRGTRPMARTNVIERLTKERDDDFARQLEGVEPEPQHEDLGIDLSTEHRPAAKRRRTSTRPVLSQTTVIAAPSVLGVEGIDMCVALDGPGKPLWMEFSGENLNYVSSVCRAQLRVGDIQRVAVHGQCDGEEGVGMYWLESRLQWRVKWVGSDGKRHCESIKLQDGATRDDSHFDVSKAVAKATAKELLQSRVSACDL